MRGQKDSRRFKSLGSYFAVLNMRYEGRALSQVPLDTRLTLCAEKDGPRVASRPNPKNRQQDQHDSVLTNIEKVFVYRKY